MSILDNFNQEMEQIELDIMGGNKDMKKEARTPNGEKIVNDVKKGVVKVTVERKGTKKTNLRKGLKQKKTCHKLLVSLLSNQLQNKIHGEGAVNMNKEIVTEHTEVNSNVVEKEVKINNKVESKQDVRMYFKNKYNMPFMLTMANNESKVAVLLDVNKKYYKVPEIKFVDGTYRRITREEAIRLGKIVLAKQKQQAKVYANTINRNKNIKKEVIDRNSLIVEVAKKHDGSVQFYYHNTKDNKWTKARVGETLDRFLKIYYYKNENIEMSYTIEK